MNTRHDTGVAAHIGKYSDAVSAPAGSDWLALAGTPGVRPDGTVPESFEDETRQAWQNVVAALEAGGFDVSDLVKITQYLTGADLIPAYAAVRSEFLGDARPASMLLIVPALVWPNMRVEIDGWAARER